MSMANLYQGWLAAKEQERAATERRRAIEDEMLKGLDLPDEEGAVSFSAGAYKVRVTQRFNRKIDSDTLEEIVRENGLQDIIPHFVRFKPELNLSAWKSADASTQAMLAGAITTTPGRASVQITLEEN